MNLFSLPYRVGEPAENMARDWLLLDAFPEPDHARWRAYGWARPAWTFGYSQNWKSLRAEVDSSGGKNAALIRRATGGGLVDHRADWTYAVALPLSHPLAKAGARQSYEAIHHALADSLIAAGTRVILAPCPCPPEEDNSAPLSSAPALPSTSANPSSTPATASSPSSPPSLSPPNQPAIRFPVLPACFTRAELNDIVRIDDARKVAGAAQKRSKQGLLFQGSVSRAAAAEITDWSAFIPLFAENLARLLATPSTPWPSDPFSPHLLATPTARYASPAWNEQR